MFLSKLSYNVMSKIFCLFGSQLLRTGAIKILPIGVPRCYAHPGITQSLFEDQISILSSNILKFLKSEKLMFAVDTRRAGAAV